MTGPPLWRPDAARADATHLARFLHHVGQPDYAHLHRWSVQQPDAFWAAVWEQCGVVGHRGDTVMAAGEDLPTTRFFPDATLNVAENLLHGWEGDEPALIAHDEAGRRREVSGRELRSEVGALTAALSELGVGVGDRVVAWLPNGVETVVTMLAAASLGAVFSSCSPDFGTAGALDRFGQIEPVVLVAADGYQYNGTPIDCLGRLREIRAGLPTLRATVVVPVLTEHPDLDGLDGAVMWHAFVGPHRGTEPAFVRLPFDHPWYVLYSSGTTGQPKCIVHRAGGVLLMHLKEHQLHCDVHRGDVVLYYTTTGWMMWNWLVSALASGATVILYDGSPFMPGPDRLFDLVDEEGISLLGVSARLIDALAKDGRQPARTHGLVSLRTICSTGSPLAPEGFRYVYEHVKADVHLASISGGTDLCGCLVGGDPTGAVFAGEIQRPALGMAIDVWSEVGEPLPAGRAGELVCTAPFPSMPLGFWDDGPLGSAGPRYRAAYFERLPGVWCQGDFASWTEHGGLVIHGRSDATLNPGGVRIGTADLYRVVEHEPDVAEALVFGQQWEGDVRIVLAVRLRPGLALDDATVARIRTAIRRELSPRHVPAVVMAVDDLPRTRSGKLVELAVADAVNGREVRNREAIANPDAIDAIAAREELRR